jgi:hypothetical protein
MKYVTRRGTIGEREEVRHEAERRGPTLHEAKELLRATRQVECDLVLQCSYGWWGYEALRPAQFEAERLRREVTQHRSGVGSHQAIVARPRGPKND